MSKNKKIVDVDIDVAKERLVDASQKAATRVAEQAHTVSSFVKEKSADTSRFVLGKIVEAGIAINGKERKILEKFKRKLR